MLNDGALRTETRKSGNFARRARLAPEAGQRENTLVVRRDPDIAASLIHSAKKAAAGVAQQQAHHRQSADLGFDHLHDLVDGSEADAFGSGHVDVKLCFVDVGRNIFLPHHLVERDRRYDDRRGERHYGDPMPHRPGEHARVAAVEPAVKSLPRMSIIAAGSGMFLAQHPRAHHRCQGK
jgi:hypothetical protein